MIARSRAITTGALLSFICHLPPAAARGSAVTADQPWNPEHLNQLPAEVRNAVSRLCGPSLRAAHYFATYSENSRFLNLHFEHSQCQSQKVCTQAGCEARSCVWNSTSLRAKRSNPYFLCGSMDCFASLAMTAVRFVAWLFEN
jgi:hypothetical protein